MVTESGSKVRRGDLFSFNGKKYRVYKFVKGSPVGREFRRGRPDPTTDVMVEDSSAVTWMIQDTDIPKGKPGRKPKASPAAPMESPVTIAESIPAATDSPPPQVEQN